MSFARFGLYLLVLCLPLTTSAQQTSESSYSRLNTFGGFFEYSNDSSHIILGVAENRKIGAIGFQYQRRLIHRRLLDFSYMAEIRPGIIESDPVLTTTDNETSPEMGVSQQPPVVAVKCNAGTSAYNFTVPGASGPIVYSGEFISACSRRTVAGQGISPAGFRMNLLPRHRLQPTFSVLGGYMFSTEQVPISHAGSYNFTFEFGGGLEFYRTPTQSMRLEYQIQHFSNGNTAVENPGVDSGLIKLTYTFGR